MCACVCPLGYKKTIYVHAVKPETSSIAFLFACMALAMDITKGHGLSNKARQLLSKKSKVMLYLPFNLQKRTFTQ